MNLNTITEVQHPASMDQITQWRDGYAWLGGGTWLFSEPQVATDTLIDLDALRWPALEQSAAGLEIAATCRIAEPTILPGLPGSSRYSANAPTRCWRRSRSECRYRRRQRLHARCPGAMISLTVALKPPTNSAARRGARTVRHRLVTGNHANVLRPGELPQHSCVGGGAVEAVRRPSRRSRISPAAADRHAQRTGDDLLIRSQRRRRGRSASVRAHTVGYRRRMIDERIPADG